MRCRLLGLAVFVAIICQLLISLQAAEIPLGTSGGVFTVPVQINRSITMQFLVDTGSAVVIIPMSVLRNLIRNGTVTEGDVIGIGGAATADRSLYLMGKLRLRELRIGETVVRDVIAAVSPGLDVPLLGQSFFLRFASVTIDNRRQTLILTQDGSAPMPQSPAIVSRTPYPSSPATGAYSGGGYGAPGYNSGYGR